MDGMGWVGIDMILGTGWDGVWWGVERAICLICKKGLGIFENWAGSWSLLGGGGLPHWLGVLVS